MQNIPSLRHCLRILIVTGLLGLSACGSAENESSKVEAGGSGRYQLVAQQFAQQLLLPGFANHASAASSLQQTIAQQCSADVIDESALQAAWTTAYLSWQKTNFLLFGPLTEERALRLQFYPDKRQLVPVRVQQLLQNPATISREKIAIGTAPTQGYPALEQLVFAVPATDPHRCQLMSAIAAFVATQAAGLSTDWQQQAATFIENGEEAVGRAVDSLQRAVYRLHERRLAAPLGLGAGNDRLPAPTSAEAAVAKQSLPAMLATVESLRQWLTGPAGLQALANDATTREYFTELEATFATVITALQAEKLPLAIAVVEQPDGLLAIHAGSLATLKNQLGQLNTVLNVYTGFNADDGD